MQQPLSLTRVAFPRRQPSGAHRDLILQAVQGWGDPEQLTDAEAAELKGLCARWFGLDTAPALLRARTWQDAVVFSMGTGGPEYAIIVTQTEDPLLLYRFDRGHRLIPATHSTMQYLEHVVDIAVAESCGVGF